MIAKHGWIFVGLVAGGLGLMAEPTHANCSDQIASPEVTEPAIQRIWTRLRQQTQFPWGTANPYERLKDGTIELNPTFDTLTGTQKQQVLQALKLEYSSNWFEELTAEEQQAALKNPGIGAIPAYHVYDSDSRALSLPYDGCTRMVLLTEKDRFSWYYNQAPQDPNTPNMKALLRNSGRPPWRTVRFPITAVAEQTVRLKFWRTLGFAKADQGWWIAWVPELGEFEINVPKSDQIKALQPFLRIAPAQYRYRVLLSDGTPAHKLKHPLIDR